MQGEPTSRDPFLHSRGMRIPKDAQITKGRMRGALKGNSYERRECAAALRMVRKDDIVLELGGGIGYLSTLIAIKRNVRAIHVYEANPSLTPYIRALHVANGVKNATVYNALLGAGSGGPVQFYVRRNLLASSMDSGPDKGDIIATEMIEQRDINAVLADLRPTVLICDIEGAEAQLLPAADLSCLRVAIVELHPQWIGQRGVQAVFDAMHRAGLTYFPKASDAKVVTFRKDW